MAQGIVRTLGRKPFVGLLAFVIVLLMMPLGHALMILTQEILGERYQYVGAVEIGLIGAAALFVSVLKTRETAQTFLGLFAGIFLWTGFVEFSFVFYARHLGIAPVMENGEVVTKPEYLIMPSSIGILVCLTLYFLLNPHTRCRFFAWFRRLLRIQIPPTPSGGARNYAIITAMETIFVLWAFYILLLVAYDDAIFGDRHPFTYAVFGGSLLWSIYLITRLVKRARIAPAIRYAIPTVIIFWTAVEILGRWNFFKEIWIEPQAHSLELGITFAALVGAFVLSILTSQSRVRAKHSPSGKDGP